MLRDSQLYQSLERFAFNPLGSPMCFYEDPAYPLRLHLQKPYRNVVLTPAMQAYNKAMSNVRSSVEWLFGDIINYFKFMDFKKKPQDWNELRWEDVCGLCPFTECTYLLIWQPNITVF